VADLVINPFFGKMGEAGSSGPLQVCYFLDCRDRLILLARGAEHLRLFETQQEIAWKTLDQVLQQRRRRSPLLLAAVNRAPKNLPVDGVRLPPFSDLL